MSQAELTSFTIAREQVLVEGLRLHIKELYSQLSESLKDSGNVITKSIENQYKEIDAAFNKKSKYEQNIVTLKRQLFVELGIV